VLLVVTAFVSVLLAFGMLCFFLSVQSRLDGYGLNSNRKAQQHILKKDKKGDISNIDLTDEERKEFIDLREINVEFQPSDEDPVDMGDSSTLDIIQSIIRDNYVNLMVAGATIFLIGILAFLLKRNTVSGDEGDLRQMALDALQEATRLFSQAQQLVNISKQDPNNPDKENEAVQCLLDTGEAIDRAVELVREYKEERDYGEYAYE
jgi:hypothetical protein